MDGRQLSLARRAISQALMLYLAPFLVPLTGAVATKDVVRGLAEQTLPGVLSAREKYCQLADRQYRELVTAPIRRPPLRDYTAESWAASMSTVLLREQTVSTTTLDGREISVQEPEPIGEPDIEEVLVKADLQGREAERSQLIAYSLHDDEIKGWARVDREPPTCPFCTMLISRGPVYTSAKTAGDRNRFHGGCTCEVVLVTEANRTSYRGIEITKAAAQIWKESSTGRQGKAVTAEFRRRVEAQNGVTRRAQKGRTKANADTITQDSAAEDLRAAKVQLDTLSKIRPRNEAQRKYQLRATQAVTKRIAALQKSAPGG
jgi:hypothetical protein